MESELAREDILRRIGQVEHWYHRIPITPDITTPGAQDTETMLTQVGIPEDCTGMRVLDIGARDGFFSFEVERRGAVDIVALDNVPPDKTGFSVAKDLLGSRVEYVTDNVYNLSVERFGRFDMILFFGVLYHLRHPLLALDRIWDVSNQGARLYVESHMIDEGLVDSDGGFHRLDTLNEHLLGLPLVEFFPGRMLAGDFTSTWAPNKVALIGMLESCGFDVTDTWLLSFRGGASAVARELDPDGQRAADAASEWDLAQNRVTSGSNFSPKPVRRSWLPRRWARRSTHV
jgi:tRNA (mo5U34)-methyltransferase